MSTPLETRLRTARIHLEAAQAAMAEGGADDDGRTRSLTNDMRYLRDRVDERLEQERMG